MQEQQANGGRTGEEAGWAAACAAITAALAFEPEASIAEGSPRGYDR